MRIYNSRFFLLPRLTFLSEFPDPLFAKWGYPIKPMTRMSIGFVLGGLNMIIGAIVQWKVYKTSPCGYYATTCAEVSAVSLWWQIPLNALPAIGELFV